MTSRFLGLAGIALFACAAPARADLSDDADRLVRLWGTHGAHVERLAPSFLDHGHPRSIKIAAAEGSGEPGCVTIALLAVRTAEFTVGPESLPSRAGSARAAASLARGASGEPRMHSAGGAAVLARCGDARPEIARIVIELVSSRAAVEIVVARSAAPIAELREILPERAAGPTAPHGDAGGPLEPGPLAERIARAERRARSDGATQITRNTTHTPSSGAGQVDLALADGCHRVDVMAEVPATVPRRATDVDAEARDASGRLLARDRADVPDARLDFCTGESGPVSVAFIGAAGAVGVTLSDARWPLPEHVPSRWGPRARAGFGAALFRRRAPEPQSAPIFESLGVQGPTSIPVAIEPGRCYLVAMALVRGEARSVRLQARIGDRFARDDAGERADGAALTFCAEGEDVARLDADVRGSSPWWALAMWPMGAASP